MNIRPTTPDDIPGLQAVLDATDLFPSEILPDMLAESDDAEALWFTCAVDGAAVGFCYTVPEEMTEGTWNMLAIAVMPARHRSGHGAALVARVEAALRERGARLVIVDTSGTDGFADTRAFYAALSYGEEARIRDFWDAGDDKVTFRKAL